MVEHECPRCHREIELPLGELCPDCRREIERRAARVARVVAMVTTLALAVYIGIRVPADPTARLVGGAAVAVWYLLTNLVVRRLLREYFQ
ncbi:MAG TPA: hypothetical protein VGA22_11805 [Gemmatimonadales bacterium]